MNTPHKHAEVIKKWADGAKIQVRDPASRSQVWEDTSHPQWVSSFEYRVKPNKVTGWINIHPVNDRWYPGCKIHGTKEDAKRNAPNPRSQQVEIEYEKE